jgi:F-type H+-transporting ATPase subunit gamma
MSDLQSLKQRIKNIKNTAKVTKSMKLISANKLKKATHDLEIFQGTKKLVDDMINNLLDNDNYEKLKNNYQKFFKINEKKSSVMLIVVASNKGLCGSFNSNLFKTIEDEITLLLKEGRDISIITIGNKAYNYFKYSNQEFLMDSYSNIQKFEVENSVLVTDLAMKKFLNNEIDECRVYYNQYLSSISQQPKYEILLPIQIEEKSHRNDISTQYEGSDLLEKLVKQYLYNKILECLLENKAGEESFRMTSMESATNNATKISNQLTLQYNRTRQSVITNEICEIISGAEGV